MYIPLAALFFVSVFAAVAFLAFQVARAFSSRARDVWHRQRRRALLVFALWLGGYALFILLGTGPEDLSVYPSRSSSAYKLPWRSGAKRFVGQGNRSFTSHRGSHLFAWDFWMPIGTEVVAARAGIVVDIDDGSDGIGLHSNDVVIEHEEGTRAHYAHVRYRGALVKVGDRVEQGQLIALSGMVGQTLNPHLHFFVTDRAGMAAVPVSFQDVPNDGVPRACSWYTSGNTAP